jgi:hypothetical protein
LKNPYATESITAQQQAALLNGIAQVAYDQPACPSSSE